MRSDKEYATFRKESVLFCFALKAPPEAHNRYSAKDTKAESAVMTPQKRSLCLMSAPSATLLTPEHLLSHQPLLASLTV